MSEFLSLAAQIAEVEDIVGIWSPEAKFTNMYTVVDLLQDQIENFYYKVEEVPSTTPKQSTKAVYTPSYSRHASAVGKKATAFNQDLEKLLKLLGSMKDVDYDKNKLDLVHGMAESSISDEIGVMRLLLSRLKLLDKMKQ
jgi:hypothetical protein